MCISTMVTSRARGCVAALCKVEMTSVRVFMMETYRHIGFSCGPRARMCPDGVKSLMARDPQVSALAICMSY